MQLPKKGPELRNWLYIQSAIIVILYSSLWYVTNSFLIIYMTTAIMLVVSLGVSDYYRKKGGGKNKETKVHAFTKYKCREISGMAILPPALIIAMSMEIQYNQQIHFMLIFLCTVIAALGTLSIIWSSQYFPNGWKTPLWEN